MMRQVARFGIVGVGAMLVHLACVAVLVPLSLAPLVANVIAFLVAFQVSCLGHHYWTFADNRLTYRQAMRRFFMVSAWGFAVNETLYWVLLRYTALPYLAALVIVLLAVAGMTFLLGRFWAFSR